MKETKMYKRQTASENGKYCGRRRGSKRRSKKGFYLKELHGFVVVYLEDKKTIYEFTEIPLSDLPEEVRQEIAQGKQIATAEELYAFLENYSS